MLMPFRQLYLCSGCYESAKVTMISVAFDGEGFETWQESVLHFRASLLELAKQQRALRIERDQADCPRCAGKAQTDEERFCPVCGKALLGPTDVDDDLLNEEAASIFCSWFNQELHQLVAWEALEGMGWRVADMTTGGFVILQGFDQALTDWDWDDPADRFSNSELYRVGVLMLDSDVV